MNCLYKLLAPLVGAFLIGSVSNCLGEGSGQGAAAWENVPPGEAVAGHGIVSVQFKGDGAAMAIRSVGTIDSRGLVYSLFDASSDSWIPEKLVPESVTADSFPIHYLATNGSGFLLVNTRSYNTLFARSGVRAAFFDGSTWSESMEIGNPFIQHSGVDFADIVPISAASNGTGYAVAWSQAVGGGRTAFARTYDGVGWNDLTWLGSGSSYLVNPSIACDGEGYAVVWYDVHAGVYASVYSNGVWGGARRIDDPVLGDDVQGARIESSGGGYAAVWTRIVTQDNRKVGASVYHGGVWSREIHLDGPGISGRDVEPFIAADKTGGYAVAWSRSIPGGSESAQAAVFDGAAWSAPHELDSCQRVNTSCLDYKLAVVSNGTGFAVTWIRSDNGVTRPYGAVYVNQGWQTSAPLSAGTRKASDVNLATDGNRYLATWEQTNGEVSDIHASLHAGSGWGPDFSIETGDGSAGDIRAEGAEGRLMILWTQDTEDGEVGYYNVYHDGWTGERRFPQRVITSSAYKPQIVANQSGELLAAWVQERYFNHHRLFANIRTAGGWNESRLLADDLGDQHDFRVASTANRFAVAWVEQLENDERRLHAVVYDGGWASPVRLDDRSMTSYLSLSEVAAGPAGIVVAWWQRDEAQQENLFTAIHDGSAWGPTQVIADPGVDIAVGGPQVAAGNRGFGMVWKQASGINAAIHQDGGWGNPVRLSGDLLSESSQTIATDGSGYAVAWVHRQGEDYGIYAAHHDGAGWTEAQVIQDGSLGGRTSYPSIAGGAGGYAMTWGRDGENDVYAAVLADGAWSNPSRLGRSRWTDTSSRDPCVSSNDSGFVVAWLATAGVSAAIYDGAKWISSDIYYHPSYNFPEHVETPRVASTAGRHAVVWYHEVERIGQVLLATYEGDGWTRARQLHEPTLPLQPNDPQVTAFGDHFAIAWLQNDPETSPIARLVQVNLGF